MTWARAGDVLTLVFVVAVIYMLVRPNSPAVATVDAISRAFVALVRRATDLANE